MKKIKLMAIAAVLCMSLLLTSCASLGTGKKDSKAEGALSYWMPLSATDKIEIMNMAEAPLGKALKERTGIDVEYIHPDSEEQFNLMLASGDLPDVIQINWVTGYPGGPEKAIRENQIITFDELMEEHAPNLTKYLKEHPEIDKLVTTSDGKHYMFPFIRGDEYLLISNGPVVRKDWLDELGMDVPETMEDWYNMLKAFKEKASSAPLTTYLPLANGVFSSAYGAPQAFFVDNGEIKYGPMLDGYKACLMELNRWYKEGLLDNNFMGVDSKMMDSAILSGGSGATVGSVGGGIGKWMAAASEEGYDLAAAPYPVLNKGEKAMFSARQNSAPGYGAAISTKCENPELAMQLLDYFYSEEGSMLLNFGIEGESYEMIDGYPTYTELVTKNPEGKSMAAVLGLYARSATQAPFIQDRRYMEQYAALPQQKEAIEVWSDTDAAAHILPPLTPSTEESSELAKILGDVNTYVSEYTTKFVAGQISFNDWDKYISQLKSLKIDRAIEIYQNAYNEFSAK